jgi:hypothetical protein
VVAVVAVVLRALDLAALVALAAQVLAAPEVVVEVLAEGALPAVRAHHSRPSYKKLSLTFTTFSMSGCQFKPSSKHGRNHPSNSKPAERRIGRIV